MEKFIERLRDLDTIINETLFLSSEWQREADDLLSDMADWEEGEETPSIEQLESAKINLENELLEARDLLKALINDIQTASDMEALEKRTRKEGK